MNLYVVDRLIFGKDISDTAQMKKALGNTAKMNIGIVRKFIGTYLLGREDQLKIHEGGYVESLLGRCDLQYGGGSCKQRGV